MGYINPLMELPAAQKLLALPAEQRRPMEQLFRELRADADRLAEAKWQARKAPLASYWRAVATYARHIAVMLSKGGQERAAPPCHPERNDSRGAAMARAGALAGPSMGLLQMLAQHHRPGGRLGLNPMAYEILVNLALRCRLARTTWAHMRAGGTAQASAIEHAHGEALEAWNSFQAAKHIAAEHAAKETK